MGTQAAEILAEHPHPLARGDRVAGRAAQTLRDVGGRHVSDLVGGDDPEVDPVARGERADVRGVVGGGSRPLDDVARAGVVPHSRIPVVVFDVVQSIVAPVSVMLLTVTAVWVGATQSASASDCCTTLTPPSPSSRSMYSAVIVSPLLVESNPSAAGADGVEKIDPVNLAEPTEVSFSVTFSGVGSVSDHTVTVIEDDG